MADYNTRQKRRNTIVGGFVIIAFCALIWMIAMFGELPVLATEWTSYEVTVRFPEAGGIHKTTPVRYLGFPVGKVTQVSKPTFTQTEEGATPVPTILARLAIDQEFRDIPANVRVRLTTRSMGSSYIELLPNKENPLPKKNGEIQFLQPGMKLVGDVGSANEFIPEHVQDKLETLVVKVTDLTENLNELVGDEENKQHIKNTIENFASMTEQAGKTLASIEELSASSEEAIVETKKNIKETLGRILHVTEQANATLESIEDLSETGKDAMLDTAVGLDNALISLNNILYKVNEGKGTIGKMINDGRLYEDLLDSAKELELALEEFKKFAEQAREEGLKVKL